MLLDLVCIGFMLQDDRSENSLHDDVTYPPSSYLIGTENIVPIAMTAGVTMVKMCSFNLARGPTTARAFYYRSS